MRMSLGRTAKASAFVASALFGVVGCSGGGETPGTGSGGSIGTGGSTGSGGTTGSGGSTGSGGTTGSGGSTGSGGTTGSGGSPGDGGPGDGGTDAPPSGLHGGTSGKYNCPAGGNYAGMVPMVTGMMTIPRANSMNGEGPIWIPQQMTFFYTSGTGGDNGTRQIWKVDLAGRTQTAVKGGTGNNGLTLDNDDKLISVDHKMSAIVRLDVATGNVVEMIASQYNGAYFRSPNDLVMRGDGNIYFSDPAYFGGQGRMPKTNSTAFYRISPTKEVSIVENTGQRDPNGIALSHDDNTLYTVVTGDRLVKKWALNADGSVNGAGMTFVAQTGSTPDGMCMDCAGNLYVSTVPGLEVYSPTGTKLATLGNGKAINCSFGGADHKTLFVTNDTGAWFGTTNIPGLP